MVKMSRCHARKCGKVKQDLLQVLERCWTFHREYWHIGVNWTEQAVRGSFTPRSLPLLHARHFLSLASPSLLLQKTGSNNVGSLTLITRLDSIPLSAPFLSYK